MERTETAPESRELAPEAGAGRASRSVSAYVYEVDLRHRIGALTLEVRFALTAPWTVLFAPSGAGKSTVLRMLAGLQIPQAGGILSRPAAPGSDEQEEILTDRLRKIFVAPHRRKVHMVTQSPALFPHRSVLNNVSFGSGPKLGAEERVEEALELCRVAHLRHKFPAQLSGGESQRAALARAIAGFGFRLLLLDEPFTGLEAELRDAILAGLRARMLRLGIPVLQVTHDVGEVFAAEAEVLRMEDGRIVAQGPAEVVLARERQALLARLQR